MKKGYAAIFCNSKCDPGTSEEQVLIYEGAETKIEQVEELFREVLRFEKVTVRTSKAIHESIGAGTSKLIEPVCSFPQRS